MFTLDAFFRPTTSGSVNKKKNTNLETTDALIPYIYTYIPMYYFIAI